MKNINLDEIKDLIRKINNKHDVNKHPLSLSENDFVDNSVEKYLEDYEENNFGKINLTDQTNNAIIILYYYYLYKNNKINFSKSNQTEEILKYFTIQNMNKNFGYDEVKQKLKELENKETYNKKVENIVKSINDLYDKYEKEGIYPNLNDGFKKSMNPIINTFITSKMFFIPLLGAINSGKSTILNCLIGCNILPKSTKRGILVNYWDYDTPLLRKAKFIVKNTGTINDISYFEINDDIKAQGYEQIKQYLKSLNSNYTKNEEDFFYILNIKIKFIDTYINNEEDKRKICFIDLPGYGKKNQFENIQIYSKFIKSCKFFLMIARDHFNDKDNVKQINNIIKLTSKYQGIPIQSLIKKFLFIINCSKDFEITENSSLKIKQSLMNDINGLDENAFKDINVALCNALNYKYYLSYTKYFSSIDYLFEKEEKHYQKDKSNFQKLKVFNKNPGKFEKYFIKNLENKLRIAFDIRVRNLPSNIIAQVTDESLKKIFKLHDHSFTERELKNIKLIFSYGQSNVENCKCKKDSNFISFYTNLSEKLQKSKWEAEEEFKNIIENNLENLTKIFNNNNLDQGELQAKSEIHNNAEERLEKFKKEMHEKSDKIYSETVDKNISEYFKKCLAAVLNHFDNLRNEVEQKLKGNNWTEINDNFAKKLQKEIKEQKNIIIPMLESLSDNLKKDYEESYEIINGIKNNSKNKMNIYELKNFISIRFGEKNYKEALLYIINDILSESETATSWKNTQSFREYIKYLFSDKAALIKKIDYIIEKTNERLNHFIKIITDLIQQYLETMSNNIEIEKNIVINKLEEQKKIEEEKNKELKEQLLKEEEEKKKKWNILCEEYVKLEEKIKEILKSFNFIEQPGLNIFIN